MTAFKLLVLLVPLFLLGAGWTSADDSEKTPVDELRERGFQVSEGCTSHKHGDLWASNTKGLNCACARRRSLCYSVTCLPDTHLAVVKGRWDCVFDNGADSLPVVKAALPQETRMNPQRQRMNTSNASPRVLFAFTAATSILDGFSVLFAVLGDISDNIHDQTEAHLLEIKDKLDDLDQKIDGLNSAIGNLQTQVQLGNQWVEGVILYGRYEQRLRYLLHYMNARLSVDDNGQFQPDNHAQLWADDVLSFSSDGLDEILFHLHYMMMGTSGVFGRRPLFLIFEARMNADSTGYWDQVKNFLDYVVSMEVSGYAAIRTALTIKGISSMATDALNEGKERIRQQGSFLAPYVKEWPTGTYGLPMTDTGCPVAADVTWRTGQRNQDADDSSNNNGWSNGLHFPTNSYNGGTMIQNFCMKTYSSHGSGNWPGGRYCIFKKGTCPSGFQSGYVYWDDEDHGNDNYVSGYLPEGAYDDNTRIFYCCRSDGSNNTPILLPSRRPFYLFRYSSSGCQQVQNMRVTQEYFLWDDENNNNDDATSGWHPYDTGDGRNHKLWYCYYEPTW